MPTPIERLNEALTKKVIWNQLGQLGNSFRESVNSQRVTGDADETHSEFLWHFSLVNALPVFNDVVLQADYPSIITAEELARAFSQHVLIPFEVPLEDALVHFARSVDAELSEPRSSHPIATLTYHPFLGFSSSSLIGECIFEHVDEVRIWLSGELPAASVGDGDDGERTIYASISGYFTARALDEAAVEVKDVITTLLANCRIIAEYKCMRSLRRRPPYLDAESSQVMTPVEISNEPDSDELIDNYLPEVRALLNSYYEAATKKDSISRRIRNAVHLLVQADRQSRNAVGLALSVAAIECLLCRNEQGALSAMFAESVATLLEPDSSYRLQACTFTKELYDKRSQILHGAAIDFTHEELKNARILAAAVMRAFVERMRFQERMTGGDTPDSLINELRNQKWTPGQFVGVENSPVVGLWRDIK